MCGRGSPRQNDVARLEPFARLEGPIIGTAVFFLLREYLSDYGTWYLIILGMVSIATILIEPKGLWGVWRRIGKSRNHPGHAESACATCCDGALYARPRCSSASGIPVGNWSSFNCARFQILTLVHVPVSTRS